MKVLTTMSGRGSVLKFRLTRRVRASFGEQRMRIGTALADEKSMGSRLTITGHNAHGLNNSVVSFFQP